jgi:hypothetical protein
MQIDMLTCRSRGELTAPVDLIAAVTSITFIGGSHAIPAEEQDVLLRLLSL